MSRLPYLKREDLSDDGRTLWDSITETRGAAAVNEEGGLVGPFNAWVSAPHVGAKLADLGAVLRFGTSMDRKVLELAIITTAAHWRSEFEWWAHTRMAREHGVEPAVIDAIRAGDEPPLSSDAERAVVAAAKELAANGRLTDSTYESARLALGDQGLIELVAVCGYYALVSFTLNAFDVPLPPGQQPAWAT